MPAGDAALAAMGIMVVRFTHDQPVYSPDLVRAQVRAIVAARLGLVIRTKGETAVRAPQAGTPGPDDGNHAVAGAAVVQAR